MNFAHTIVYVIDVGVSLAFFEAAFGLQRRFLHESGSYGGLETGATALAFVDHATARNSVGCDDVAATQSASPAGHGNRFELRRCAGRLRARRSGGLDPAEISRHQTLGPSGRLFALPGRHAGGVVHADRLTAGRPSRAEWASAHGVTAPAASTAPTAHAQRPVQARTFAHFAIVVSVQFLTVEAC